MANVMFADTYKGEIRMKRVILEMDLENKDDMTNDMLIELIESELQWHREIDGISNVKVLHMNDYLGYVSDLENRSSHFNYGYEE